MRAKKNLKGVTLIEMMVAISVMVLLLSVGVTLLNQVRIKARDAVRISDIQQMERALALYYQDHGQYPETTDGGGVSWYGSCAEEACHADWGVKTNDWIPGLPQDLIVRLPLDPYTDDCTRCYLYRSDGDDYKILAHTPENSANETYLALVDPTRDGGSDGCSLELNIPPGSSPWAWSVFSAGARCW